MNATERYQPVDQARADRVAYRILDVRDQTYLGGFATSASARDEVLHNLRRGYDFKHALWLSCLTNSEWIHFAGLNGFARFAQFRSLCLEYSLLVFTKPQQCFVLEWTNGRPTAFIGEN